MRQLQGCLPRIGVFGRPQRLFLQNSSFLPFPVLVFLVSAFVVLFLALAKTDVQFGTALVPVEVQGN